MNAHNAILEVWLGSLDDRLNLVFSAAWERISLKIDESAEKSKLPSIPTPVFSGYDEFRVYKEDRMRQLQYSPTPLSEGLDSLFGQGF